MFAWISHILTCVVLWFSQLRLINTCKYTSNAHIKLQNREQFVCITLNVIAATVSLLYIFIDIQKIDAVRKKNSLDCPQISKCVTQSESLNA